MKKLILLALLGVYLWYKVVKGMIYTTKVPNTIEFEKVAQEAAVIEVKIKKKEATITEVQHYNDLMDSLQWCCYGITSRLDVEGVCMTIATLYPSNANPELLYQFLLEIAAVESALGTSIYDINRGYGYGLFQFDPIAFDDVKDLIKRKHSTAFFLICQRDIDQVKYEDLKTEALTAAFFARIFLKHRIPQAVSADINERARQWKTYYNTYKGKGTVEKYLAAAISNNVAYA